MAALLACLCLIQTAPAWTAEPVPSPLDRLEARAVAATPDGSVWIATRERGLARLEGDSIGWTPPDWPTLPDGIAELTWHRGSLWALGLGGAAELGDRGWVLRTSFGGVRPRVVSDLATSPDGTVTWFATSSGAIRLHADSAGVLDEDAGLEDPVVHDVVVEDDGTAWLLSRSGVMERGRWERPLRRPELNFRAGLVGPDGLVWFGTSDGLLRLVDVEDDEWYQELAGVTVYPRVVADDGSVWAGSAADGLLRWSRGEWQRIPLPRRFDGAEVFDVDVADDGTVWVATAVGVARLRPGR